MWPTLIGRDQYGKHADNCGPTSEIGYKKKQLDLHVYATNDKIDAREQSVKVSESWKIVSLYNSSILQHQSIYN